LPTDTFPGLKISKKCICSRGSARDPTRGSYSALPDPLAGLGAISRRGRRERQERGRRGEEKGGKGKGKELGKKGRKVGRSHPYFSRN